MLYLSRNLTHVALASILYLGLFFLFGNSSYAADLSISPSTGSYSVGQTFTATIKVMPDGVNINSVEASLAFNPAVLSVVSVNKTDSAFSFWTTEPIFSNSAGTIKFDGGSLSPITTSSNLLAITFRTLVEGIGSISFTETSIFEVDSRSTAVYSSVDQASYTVSSSQSPVPSLSSPPAADDDSDETIDFGDSPRAPLIESSTFLDPDTWYKDTTGLFTWTIPSDVTAVAVELSDDPDNIPQDNEQAIIDPPAKEFVITDGIAKEGIQYLSISFQNQSGWKAVTNRELKIDSTPPEPFVITVQAGASSISFPTLRFDAQDKTSGVEFYDMTVADQEPLKLTPDEARLGYLLAELEDGTHIVKVVATDMAGNIRESSVTVSIKAGWINPLKAEDEGLLRGIFTALNIFIFFLIVIILLQIIYFWYEHKQLKEKEEKLRRETKEIQDQMEKIFSALREEIYDQINNITKRKKLTVKEKQAVEGLTQALEVSETLIEKEINDVKIILK